VWGAFCSSILWLRLRFSVLSGGRATCPMDSAQRERERLAARPKPTSCADAHGSFSRLLVRLSLVLHMCLSLSLFWLAHCLTVCLVRLEIFYFPDLAAN